MCDVGKNNTYVQGEAVTREHDVNECLEVRKMAKPPEIDIKSSTERESQEKASVQFLKYAK